MRTNSVLIIAFVAAAIVSGAQCKLHPRSIPGELMKRLDMKRQAESEVDECIENTLMRTLTDSECDERRLESLIGDVSDLNEDEDDADFVTNYGLFCQPECREPIVNALEVCNFFNGSEFLRDFLVDLCAVNENGRACYTLFENATGFITGTELPCYAVGLFRKECNCTAELQSAVSEQGCCINIYHTGIQGFLESSESAPDFRYVPEDLYNMYCDVGLPRDCDDINGSMALKYTVSAIVTAIGLAIFG